MTAGEATIEVPRGAGISWGEGPESAQGHQLSFLSGGTYADGDGTALAALLGGQRVRLTEVGAPVTAAHRDDAELGDDDGGADGGRDLLRGLDAETDVALGVANDDDGLETGALTGTGLLLDWLDLFGGRNWRSETGYQKESRRAHLHNLILELGQEEVDDLVLLDRERVEVDLLHALDLAGLDETAELGDGLPLLLVVLAAATTSTTATATATATVTTTIATSTTTIATSSEAATARRSSSPISHFFSCRWLLNGNCCRRGTRSGNLGRFDVRVDVLLVGELFAGKFSCAKHQP